MDQRPTSRHKTTFYRFYKNTFFCVPLSKGSETPVVGLAEGFVMATRYTHRNYSKHNTTMSPVSAAKYFVSSPPSQFNTQVKFTLQT